MDISTAIERSLFEFSLLFASFNGAAGEAGNTIKWVKTGTNAMNRIFGANLNDDTLETVVRMTRIFAGVPVRWIVGPSTQPQELEKILAEHGFKHSMEWIGMAYELTGAVPPPEVSDINIIEAKESSLMAVWAETAADGFQMAEKIKTDFVKVYKAVQLPTVHCYIAFSGTMPVAAASLNLGQEAGAYFVATRPEYRGMGYARTLMGHVLRKAAMEGYAKVVLQASRAGFEVYKTLGFKDYCRMQVYTLNI